MTKILYLKSVYKNSYIFNKNVWIKNIFKVNPSHKYLQAYI